MPGMSATALKYLAAAFMVVDHIGLIFDPLAAVFPSSSPWRYLLRYLGRIAFPIFAYFVAESCRRTRHYPAYLMRLGIFALITQLPLLLLPLGDGSSVIVTFFLAALGIFLWREGARKGYPVLGLLGLIACILLASPLRGDYGWAGAFTVAAVYLAGEKRSRQLAALSGCMICYYLIFPVFTYWEPVIRAVLRNGTVYFLGMSRIFFSRELPFVLLTTLFGLLAAALLACYNGERGKGKKWFFYWFYPGHLILLGAVGILAGWL